VRISAAGSAVTIDASNMSVSASWTAAAQVESDGEVMVPARTLQGMVDANDAERVAVAYETPFLTLRLGQTTGSFRVPDASEWSDWIPIPDSRSVKLSGEDFRRIAAVARSASDDAMRGQLTGVQLRGAAATATDSYRLSVAHLGTSMPTALVHAQMLQRLSTLGITEWRVNASDKAVCFASDECSWRSLLVTGEIPDQHELVEGHRSESHVDLERAAIKAALGRVATMASVNKVSLCPHAEGIELRYELPDLGTISEVVATGERLPYAVTLHRQYLQDALESEAGSGMRLHLNGPGKPVVLASDAFSHLIFAVKDAPVAEH
jgi:DNA polymerase III sliding clamp (beta) subunit (PCNA family)